MIHFHPYPYIDVIVSAERVELLRDTAYQVAVNYHALRSLRGHGLLYSKPSTNVVSNS